MFKREKEKRYIWEIEKNRKKKGQKHKKLERQKDRKTKLKRKS